MIKNSKLTAKPLRYGSFVSGIQKLLEDARRHAARTVNSILTATYWEIGRRIVEYEQKGESRAGYGEELLMKLSGDLDKRLGRGFSPDNLATMRLFYLAYPPSGISETVSRILSAEDSAKAFLLSWSHYVILVRRTRTREARHFYEAEALRGGWSVRQLDRQIGSQFYERVALSRHKTGMLRKELRAKASDHLAPEEEIKDPYILEFLSLKDEYSENDLEEALILHLESFLLELGGDFTFVARQKRLRVGDEWYRVDLVFYHRRLRCLVLIDLKVGKFTHADAGQMHLYLNYARELWTRSEENPPVGLVLCAQKNETVARYALQGLPNKILASEYRTALPNEHKLVAELKRTQMRLARRIPKRSSRK